MVHEAGELAALSREELDPLGGVEVVVPWAMSRAEVTALLCCALALSPVAVGGVFAVWERRGVVPWAGGQGLAEAFHHGSVLTGYGLVLLLGLWLLGLHAWRGLTPSPGLVAGRCGVRVHGLWPWPETWPWEAVEALVPSGARLEVRLVPRVAPASRALRVLRHLCGAPLRVRVSRRVDLPALAATLELLRARAGATSPAPSTPPPPP